MGERFISPEPEPTRRQRELLACLIEECAEVQQRATKALRFGMAEVQPGQVLTNAERLAGELGDLRAVVDLLVLEGILVDHDIRVATTEKRPKLRKYLQTRPTEEQESADGR